MPTPSTPLSWSGLREAGTNLSVAAFYGLFALAHAQSWLAQPRASLLLAVLMEGAVAVLLVVRTRAEVASFSPWSWFTTLGGTLAPLLLRPGAEARDFPAGQAIQLLGAGLALVSVLSLRRSFGLLPAVRELRVEGAYRWVRHPIYAAYTVQNVGYLLSNQTVANLAVVVVALLFQVLRVYNEERLLVSLPSYRDYAQRVRWRLLPPLF
jgi:protein-S-isoprenylcysteine O-methyltransferase Ste14